MPLPPSWTELAAVVVDALKHGPLSTAELVAALGRSPLLRGFDARDVLEELAERDAMPRVRRLPDTRWCDLAALLHGRTVTHRLDADEVEHGYLTAYPDLAPLLVLLDDEFPAAEQETPGLVYPELDADLLTELGVPAEAIPGDGAWLLPRDFVRANRLRPGDLVALHAIPTGLRVERVPGRVAAPSEASVAALGDLLARRPDGIDVEEAAWALCTLDPTLFATPTAPFGDLIGAAGAVVHGETLLPPGTDPRRWQTERRVGQIAHTHRLTNDAALAVTILAVRYEAIRTVIEGEPAGPDAGPDLDDALAKALPHLADREVAMATLAETLGIEGGLAAAALGVLTEELADLPPAQGAGAAVRAALTWLRARAVEQLGRTEDAEQALRDALAEDPSFQPALADLALYTFDRGDLGGAADLARRARLPVDDPLVALLRHLRDVPVRDLGRNQPCWCGSGRKYKVCHLGREQVPLAERAAALYQKAGFFLDRGHGRYVALTLAQARARHRPGELWDALQEPLVADAALAEGGVFAEFLDVRGALLPDDERLLAEQWLLAERSVWEVVAVRPGRGMTLRDVRTGDQVDVREATASRVLKPGQLWCGRVLPASDTWQVFGGLEPVHPSILDDLMAVLDDDPDPLSLITVLSRRFAPPTLQNTDGQTLLAAEALFRVPDPAAARAVLDAAFERAEDLPDVGAADGLTADDASRPDGAAPVTAEPATWHHLVPNATGRTVHATLRLVGDRLALETNSAERQDRTIARLRELIPGLELVSDRRIPWSDLTPPAQPPSPGPDLDPDVVAEVLAEFVARHEAAWLDEQIPALAGLTPREAVVDPTRREDLVRLLDSFPQDDAPGQMSAHRLRAALGL